MAQGGDITKGDGTGGGSIYGLPFADETLRGNTLDNTVWLDGRHVVFGKVVDGIKVLVEMEFEGTEPGSTNNPVVIEDCGQITEG
ncbi:peptidyl-prolyl cis-trans isomerase CYP19-3 [Cucumis melo var. makuwa]|uniref:Peptidyl-prolyl cis-trans isomerase CYP19-3 n=1 Tax=Cucumis melo var. makuwa TaxID=1194695 RepID=A0A5D3DYI7_CUCMM|nr:peptidyl-prolyl cis-trans isomerase CYP19-3 [Cucumis melo var. makuwa]TYK28776.1 peptidyl-prolyl cis-trans isomerase CYP19-3 [Cucumis melo var. makuwa]